MHCQHALHVQHSIQCLALPVTSPRHVLLPLLSSPRPHPLPLPHSYSLNLVNGRVVGQSSGYSAMPAAVETTKPLLQRIRAAKLLKEKVSSMLQDAGNIDAQAKALRSQASYAQQQAADVKAEEDALRSKIMEVGSELKVSFFLHVYFASLPRRPLHHVTPPPSPTAHPSTRSPARPTATHPTANGQPNRASQTWLSLKR